MNQTHLLPQSITLYTTYNCQLSCEHCFLTQTGKLNKHTLDINSIRSIIEDAHKNNVFLIAISGGDPLLHPNIYEILEMIKQKGIVALLGITGVDVTEEQVLKIKSLGVPCIQVSLDGFDEVSNRLFRGSSVYNKVIKTIKIIKNSGIHANLAICITRENKHLLKNMLDLCSELGVYRIKVAFLEPISGKEELNRRILSEKDKQNIMSICKEINNDRKEDWILIPGYNLNTGKPNTLGKYPPLVIGADGLISVDEFGKVIGHISDGPISKIYGKFVNESVAMFIDDLINKVKRDFNISTIEEVPPQRLNSAAVIFKYGTQYQILHRNDLPIAVRLFTIIHEAAHIAENTLNFNPYDVHNQNIELSANLWALDYLKPYLNKDFYVKAVELAHISEDKLFKYISINLMDNLINYWGNNQ